MKRYKIKEFKRYPKVCFYTIHDEDVEFSEIDQFFLRFKDDAKYKSDIQIIKGWIENIGLKYGAQDRHFRPERKAKAIPIFPSGTKLRLYLHHVNEQIVILGNGGIKSSRKVQQSPDAFPHFELMNKLITIFTKKLKKGEITVGDYSLKGDLTLILN